jgi:hypothetical protein
VNGLVGWLFGGWVGRLDVNRSVSRSLSWSAGQWVGWSVVRLVGCLVCVTGGLLFGSSAGRPVCDLLGRSDGWFVSLSFIQLVGCSVCLSVIRAVMYFTWSGDHWFGRLTGWLMVWLLGWLKCSNLGDHEGRDLVHLPLRRNPVTILQEAG